MGSDGAAVVAVMQSTELTHRHADDSAPDDEAGLPGSSLDEN